MIQLSMLLHMARSLAGRHQPPQRPQDAFRSVVAYRERAAFKNARAALPQAHDAASKSQSTKESPMNNSNHPAFVDFASVEEACEAQIEESRRRLADTLPAKCLEDALIVMRSAYQRCIAFGRSYGDRMAAAYGTEIRSVMDLAVTRFVDAALCEDMPELASPIVTPDVVEATRMVVMMAAHERITAARIAHIVTEATSVMDEEFNEDPIGTTGRRLGEMQAIRAPYRFNVFADRKTLETVKDEAASLLPMLDTGSADAESCLAFVLDIAAERLAEIRATYSPTRAFNRAQ